MSKRPITIVLESDESSTIVDANLYKYINLGNKPHEIALAQIVIPSYIINTSYCTFSFRAPSIDPPNVWINAKLELKTITTVKDLGKVILNALGSYNKQLKLQVDPEQKLILTTGDLEIKDISRSLQKMLGLTQDSLQSNNETTATFPPDLYYDYRVVSVTCDYLENSFFEASTLNSLANFPIDLREDTSLYSYEPKHIEYVRLKVGHWFNLSVQLLNGALKPLVISAGKIFVRLLIREADEAPKNYI